MMRSYRIRSKVWLEVDGRPFLGDGRFRLLSAIRRHGSISAAARALDISYRKVWAQLKAMEEVASFPLLDCRVGGKDGGATYLTQEILDLMDQFEALRFRINQETDRCFSECFNFKNDNP